MSGFNMPPGVSPDDIPGNRTEDYLFERVILQMTRVQKLLNEGNTITFNKETKIIRNWLRDLGYPYDV